MNRQLAAAVLAAQLGDPVERAILADLARDVGEDGVAEMLLKKTNIRLQSRLRQVVGMATGKETIHVPIVGDLVSPDGWKTRKNGWRVVGLERETVSGCSWKFRIRSSYGFSVPVNIRVTGRTIRYLPDLGHQRCVRILIEYIQEDDPSVFDGGWLYTKG